MGMIMGHLHSTCTQPRRGFVLELHHERVQLRALLLRAAQQLLALVVVRGVALQVAFERQILKPVFSLDRL
jgi:hypothetical protein